MLKKILYCLFFLYCNLAFSQSLIWESQSFSSGDAIPSGTTFTYNGATVTLVWSVTSNGGFAVHPGFNDYVTYDSGQEGAHTGFLSLAFDNSSYDKSDYISVTFYFSTPQTGIYFSILDIDARKQNTGSNWDDLVDLHYNGSINVAANTSLWSYAAGPAVRTVTKDNEPSFGGWEGRPAGNANNYDWTADPDQNLGNINVNFIGLSVSNFTLTFRSTDDSSGNPGPQRIGISDIYVIPEAESFFVPIFIIALIIGYRIFITNKS